MSQIETTPLTGIEERHRADRGTVTGSAERAVPMRDHELIATGLTGIEDRQGFFEALFAHAPVAFEIIAADGSVALVNDAFRRLFRTVPPPGYNVFEDELVERQGFRAAIERAFAGEVTHIPAHWFLPRDASAPDPGVAVEVQILPLRDAAGRVTHIAACFKDVTAELRLREANEALRRREEELRTSEEMLRVALQASRSMAWTMDFATDKITYAGNVEELGSAPGSTFEERIARVHPDDRAPVVEGLRNARLGVRPPAYTYRVRRRSEEDYRWVEARSVFLHDASGVPTGAVGLAIDITDRMRAMEMQRRTTELELQNEQVREASRMKSEFLANMSHELRTPLNAITGFAELLHDGEVDPASPEHKEFLASILTSAGHLLQLISDVLDLSKIEAGRLDLSPEPLDLAATLGEVCGLLRPMASGKHIELELEVDPRLPSVEVDPARFKQVLFNYLSNAIKFTHDGGRVRVRTAPDDEGTFRLSVEDTGIGIAPEDIGRLFIDFQQLDRSPGKRYGGTGLGLALTRRLVEAQGGRVGVQSAHGRGSVFFAVLPVAFPLHDGRSIRASSTPERATT